MTVTELIEELKKYPGDWKVIGEDLNYWYKVYGVNNKFGENAVAIDVDRRFFE